ncbi:MAG: hypothetical protein L0170_18960, partial [Acidobacteria bacterium]|nr:hypothetical protein [Acidobacteriota bacterium]
GEVDHLIDRILGESAVIAEAREGAPVHGVDSEWKVDIWYLLPAHEQQLASLGAPARDRILEVVRRPDTHPLQRATLLRILSQMRDAGAAPATLEVLARDRDERVVTECLRVLALSGSREHAEVLRKEFGRSGIRPKRLLWSLAMLGDRKATDDFLSVMEGLVRIRPLVPPEGLSNPLPEVPSAGTFAHVLLRDEGLEITRDLAEDLTDLSLMSDPRVVRILIEALSSHRQQILRTSEYLLEQILDVDLRRQTGGAWRALGALYTLRAYHGMVRWWEKAGPKLLWSPEKKKFVLPSE